MTKEELKQEFEKYFEQKNNEGYLWVTQEMEQSELKDDCEMVCLDFAEPREKRIADLQAQIEKMKCCYNCKHSRTDYEHCKTDKSEKWEIKENDVC